MYVSVRIGDWIAHAKAPSIRIHQLCNILIDYCYHLSLFMISYHFLSINVITLYYFIMLKYHAQACFHFISIRTSQCHLIINFTSSTLLKYIIFYLFFEIGQVLQLFVIVLNILCDFVGVDIEETWSDFINKYSRCFHLDHLWREHPPDGNSHHGVLWIVVGLTICWHRQTLESPRQHVVGIAVWSSQNCFWQPQRSARCRFPFGLWQGTLPTAPRNPEADTQVWIVARGQIYKMSRWILIFCRFWRLNLQDGPSSSKSCIFMVPAHLRWPAGSLMETAFCNLLSLEVVGKWKRPFQKQQCFRQTDLGLNVTRTPALHPLSLLIAAVMRIRTSRLWWV